MGNNTPTWNEISGEKTKDQITRKGMSYDRISLSIPNI